MREGVRVTGMVLSAMPVGEYDRRVVMLTKERGKLTMFARGARKPNSPFVAATNPFVFGTFSLYEGRAAYNMQGAEIKEYFDALAKEQPGIYYGFYFLEIADYFGREGTDEAMMLNLLYVTMKALLSHRFTNRLIRRVFEIKALAINGVFDPAEAAFHPSLLYTCRYIVDAPLNKLYSFAVTEELLAVMEKFMDDYLYHAIDKKLKSAAMIDIFEKN